MPEDQAASDTLQKAPPSSASSTSPYFEMFVPGLKRGYAIIPLIPEGGKQRTSAGRTSRPRCRKCATGATPEGLDVSVSIGGHSQQLWGTSKQPHEPSSTAAAAG